jgi:outer membrane protein assembly factor BamB
VSFISLPAGLTKWKSIPDEIVDVRPTVAGVSVAVIAHGFHTIYGFSKATGELLWQKETRSTILESDGNLFYVLTEDERTLHALNPASGNVIWSLRLPYPESGFYSYHVHRGRLYSASVVVDLSRKVIVHRWPEEPVVNALAFGDQGQILTGDELGVVRIYDHAFRRLRTIRTDRKAVVGLASVGRDVLVSTEAHRSGVYRAAFARAHSTERKSGNLPGGQATHWELLPLQWLAEMW